MVLSFLFFFLFLPSLQQDLKTILHFALCAFSTHTAITAAITLRPPQIQTAQKFTVSRENYSSHLTIYSLACFARCLFFLQTPEEDFLGDNWRPFNDPCGENLQQELGLAVRIHSVYFCPEGKH